MGILFCLMFDRKISHKHIEAYISPFFFLLKYRKNFILDSSYSHKKILNNRFFTKGCLLIDFHEGMSFFHHFDENIFLLSFCS